MTRIAQTTLVVALSVLLYGCRDGEDAEFNRAPSGLPKPTATLTNAGFEQGATPWHFYFNESEGKIVHGEGIESSNCAKLVVRANNQHDGFSQVIAPLNSKSIEFSAKVAAGGSDVIAYLAVECINPDIDTPDAEYGVLATSQSELCPLNGEWTQLKTTTNIPPKTTHIRVFALASGTDGDALFDDFVLARQPASE